MNYISDQMTYEIGTSKRAVQFILQEDPQTIIMSGQSL